ncbi:MAG TPA: hypothetical protein VFZ58_04680 [Candidatus Saccharimonadales bacterium]
MTPALSADIYTLDQLSVCIQELRKLVGEQRDKAAQAHMNGASASTAAPSMTPLAASLLHANQLADPTPKELEEVIKALETLRLHAPVIHLTLASLPGPKLLAKLVDWFRKEIHPQVLLTLVMDRTIGGGIIIRTHASVHDFSFTSQLLRQKDRLTEIAARV